LLIYKPRACILFEPNTMMTTTTSTPHPPFAVVTGAASGIGYQLARCCAEHGYDLLVAADSPDIEDAATALRELGGGVESVLADPSSPRGAEQIHRAAAGRPVDALLIHAGTRGTELPTQGQEGAQALIETQIAGALALLHRLGGAIRPDGQGRVLVTGSLPGFVPAFVDSFSLGLSSRIATGGARVICVVPGAGTDVPPGRAKSLHTRIIHAGQDDPTAVAAVAFQAMLQGEEGDGKAPAIPPFATPAASVAVPASLLAHVLRGTADRVGLGER
jgi:short-subunit dehydrogenase